MKLRYDNTTPNFFEVFIEDADVDFGMKLISDVEGEIVWDHTIRKGQKKIMPKISVSQQAPCQLKSKIIIIITFRVCFSPS